MMSRTKLNNGRVNQKQRTRKAILDAVTRLVDNGISPTIDEVAEEAKVSRATAYRYFPSLERLLLESYLDKKIISADELLKDFKEKTPSEKMAIVQDYLHDFVSNNEVGFRLYLKACLDEWVATNGKSEKYLRGGRRLIMIDAALEDAKKTLTNKDFMRLRFSLAAMTSVEAFIALRDVCRLNSLQAKETMKWTVQKLLDSVLKKD